MFRNKKIIGFGTMFGNKKADGFGNKIIVIKQDSKRRIERRREWERRVRYQALLKEEEEKKKNKFDWKLEGF